MRTSHHEEAFPTNRATVSSVKWKPEFLPSVIALTGTFINAHYLVPDPSDKSYTGASFKNMRILNLVDEYERAWHTRGISWAGRSNLNDTSIGIEMVNLATDKNE